MADRVIHDGIAQLRWAVAKTAEICEECSALIWPGDRVALYTNISTVAYGRQRRARAPFCQDCGALLEDSMTTTEAR
jgi:hypothetical protein